MGAANRGPRRPRSHRHPLGGSPRRGDRRGDGDAKANQALAAAFSQDPQFYSFYRSLQTYRNALANSAPTMVVSPDADFIQILKSGPKLDAASAPVAEGAKP